MNIFDKLWRFFRPLRKHKGKHYGDFAGDMIATSKVLNILTKWYFECNPQETDLPDWYAAGCLSVNKMVRAWTGRPLDDNAVDASHYFCALVKIQEQKGGHNGAG